MDESLRKESLIAELAAARDQLAGHSLGLRRSLSVSENLKRGVHRHPAAWFGGAIVLGLLLSRIPARRKEVTIKGPNLHTNNQASQAGKAAFAVTVLKFALDMAKPNLMRWVRNHMAGGGVTRNHPQS